MAPSTAPNGPRLPRAPVDRLTRPLRRFLEIESASGVILLLCTFVAMALANSPAAHRYHALWESHFHIGFAEYDLNYSLHEWINDGLMTLFFFAVGLEIKRETVRGELSDPRKAALPVVGALGGMIAPALIYASFGHTPAARPGWGIPMATDIAFVVGFLALFGRRVPGGLKIFLLSLAIADDIGAVLVIAFVYSTNLQLHMLGLAGAGFFLLYVMSRLGVRAVSVYAVVGAGIWLAFLKSGVHPTVAGVMLGLFTPASAWLGEATVRDVLTDAWRRVTGHDQSEERPDTLKRVRWTVKEGVSPLDRLESALHPWVAFGIMPLFALANAGVAVQTEALGSQVAMAVATGLFFGKPLGIVLFCWIAVRFDIARLPGGVNWRIMLAAGVLGGIGFTMSLFVASLALPPDLLDAGKIGTLTGSLASAVTGCILLWLFLPRKHRNQEDEQNGSAR